MQAQVHVLVLVWQCECSGAGAVSARVQPSLCGQWMCGEGGSNGTEWCLELQKGGTFTQEVPPALCHQLCATIPVPPDAAGAK